MAVLGATGAQAAQSAHLHPTLRVHAMAAMLACLGVGVSWWWLHGCEWKGMGGTMRLDVGRVGDKASRLQAQTRAAE